MIVGAEDGNVVVGAEDGNAVGDDDRVTVGIDDRVTVGELLGKLLGIDGTEKVNVARADCGNVARNEYPSTVVVIEAPWILSWHHPTLLYTFTVSNNAVDRMVRLGLSP